MKKKFKYNLFMKKSNIKQQHFYQIYIPQKVFITLSLKKDYHLFEWKFQTGRPKLEGRGSSKINNMANNNMSTQQLNLSIKMKGNINVTNANEGFKANNTKANINTKASVKVNVHDDNPRNQNRIFVDSCEDNSSKSNSKLVNSKGSGNNKTKDENEEAVSVLNEEDDCIEREGEWHHGQALYWDEKFDYGD